MVAFRQASPLSADRQLEQDVFRALIADDPLQFRHVSVRVQRGVLVLLGYVSSAALKSRALRLTEQVPGILAAIDSLHVELVPRLSDVLLDH